MTKTLRVWVLGLIICGFQTGTSFAAADWLDKLSGPGPFHSSRKLVFETSYRFMCVTAKPADNGNTVDNDYHVSWLYPWEGSALSVGVGLKDKISPAAAAKRGDAPGDVQLRTGAVVVRFDLGRPPRCTGGIAQTAVAHGILKQADQ